MKPPALIEAALRARCHYLDVTGEALVTIETFARYADSELNIKRVRDADIVLVPSMAFYGALGDLLATVALGNWTEADDISIAVALDSWKPTRGTRLAGERRAGRRVIFENGRVEVLPPNNQIPTAKWEFPSPFGSQEIIGEFPTVDLVTMSRHLRAAKISAFLNVAPIRDLRDPNTPGPEPADESGRSAQIFLVEVVARRDDQKRSAIARGATFTRSRRRSLSKLPRASLTVTSRERESARRRRSSTRGIFWRRSHRNISRWKSYDLATITRKRKSHDISKVN